MPSQRSHEMLPVLVDHRRAAARPVCGRKPRASALRDPSRGTGQSDGVSGGFGGVGAAGRGGPAEGAVGKLIDLPPGVLLEPMVVSTLRAGVAAAGPSACFVRGVVLEVALGGGTAADRAGAGGVPYLDQVLEPDPGIVAPGLIPVVAGVGGQGFQGDDQVRPGAGGAQPPGAVAAGRPVPAGGGEREPGSCWRPG